MVVTVRPFPLAGQPARAADRQGPSPPRRRPDGGERPRRSRPWEDLGGAIRRRSIGTLVRPERKPALARCRTSRHKSAHANTQFRLDPAHAGRPASRPCRSPSTSPTSRRIPERFCGSAPASASRRTSSSRPAFRVSDRAFRRAGMDYLDQVTLDAARLLGGVRRLAARREAAAGPVHDRAPRRPISITAFGPATSCCSAANPPACPTTVHAAADARLLIPMRPGLRSLNVAMAARHGVGEAMRQTGGIAG